MTSTTISLGTAAVLAAARADRRDAQAAEQRLLERVLEWAQLHECEADQGAATFGDTPIPLGGAGCPLVSQFAVLEFGTAIGMPRRSTESLFSEVLELAYRLPSTWAQVRSGRLTAWKARQIAAATGDLTIEAAAYVDQHAAPFASRISVSELQRLVDSAISRFMPRRAEEIAAAAADSQFLEIDYDQPSYTGTCRIRGELDLPDALDLEQAVQAGAQQQKDLGSQQPLGYRRAKALGNLARGELEFDYNSGLPETAEAAARDLQVPTVKAREVVLYAHLSEEALTSGGTGWVENKGKHLVTSEQIQEWCRTAGKVTVRPVIDLNDEITSSGYRPSERLREQIALRDGSCPFPYCESDARTNDLDHIEPYDPDLPPGQTTSSNLAAPCRTHHRLKTHGDWTYTMVEPGRYLWRSPHGYTFLTDRTGTQDLTPRPVDPPGSRPDS